MSALEARAVGAEVAAEPKGLAGEDVPIGLLTTAAEIVPGIDHAPWGVVRSVWETGERKRTDLGGIQVDEEGRPILSDAEGVVCQNF